MDTKGGDKNQVKEDGGCYNATLAGPDQSYDTGWDGINGIMS